MKKVTYLIGAGASANALPVVNGLTERFKLFCSHYQEYLRNIGNGSSQDSENRVQLIRNIEEHYTVDTYAKKLYLQNKHLHTNSEYNLLINHLSAFFIYEQLKKNLDDPCNSFLKSINARHNQGIFGAFSKDHEDSIRQKMKNDKRLLDLMVKDLDYRYDSFFASVLTHNEKEEIVMPSEISIVSWNYDSQFEKAYMNFTGASYDQSLDALNFVGLKDGETLKEGQSAFIKLNGTAGFYNKGSSFGDLFDYSKHHVNKETFSIFKEILSSPRSRHENSLRFAWLKTDAAEYAIESAQKVLSESDIIVVVGYSFPYFNREVDRKIFEFVNLPFMDRRITKDSLQKVYIQAPKDNIDSIIKRFESIKPGRLVEGFSETDQFLIPNEM
ncbi:hypothetical protein U0035_04410 [Niabella yanshanensis]|uniref:SIR2-like domain-containing protein n=1 Tax=Niabella yanshanensis TaxID=577386 RepID=A0ABZ0WA69_9BACT|nr:hypothetical protein [Niabella yanshanensis]WQD39387.1 hypothetical protein U0035_04410 [Niabella yanshanensis]